MGHKWEFPTGKRGFINELVIRECSLPNLEATVYGSLILIQGFSKGFESLSCLVRCVWKLE
jgi:hypothetical protein